MLKWADSGYFQAENKNYQLGINLVVFDIDTDCYIVVIQRTID